MLKIDEVIIVEGKYDKIKVSALVDATILETGGFRIFKDPEKRALIRLMAKQRGILILTDSDTAGRKIRGYLKNIVGNQGTVKNAYIPSILGKEKRKSAPSKEGTLGVEGMQDEVLVDVFTRMGIESRREKPTEPITKTDFYTDGLTGGADSVQKRRRLAALLGLPGNLSANALLEMVNILTDREGYREAVSHL